jgi:hypothetical protein
MAEHHHPSSHREYAGNVAGDKARVTHVLLNPETGNLSHRRIFNHLLYLSGGQTGVDHASLDFVIEVRLLHCRYVEI